MIPSVVDVFDSLVDVAAGHRLFHIVFFLITATTYEWAVQLLFVGPFFMSLLVTAVTPPLPPSSAVCTNPYTYIHNVFLNYCRSRINRIKHQKVALPIPLL